MGIVLAFLAGFFLGGVFGIVIMALAAIQKYDSTRENID